MLTATEKASRPYIPDEYVRIGMSMKSPSSANSAMSSYLAATSLAREPRRQAAEDDVLPPGQLALEADAEREQRAHAPEDLHPPSCRRQDPGHRAQERRLSRRR